jgi:hypothetical protein
MESDTKPSTTKHRMALNKAKTFYGRRYGHTM